MGLVCKTALGLYGLVSAYCGETMVAIAICDPVGTGKILSGWGKRTNTYNCLYLYPVWSE